MQTYYIYIISNKNRTVFYTGVTNDLQRRVSEHKSGKGSVFTIKYNCTDLLYFEPFMDINQAIQREKYIKNRNRQWKLDLIMKQNPDMIDLSEQDTE